MKDRIDTGERNAIIIVIVIILFLLSSRLSIIAVVNEQIQRERIVLKCNVMYYKSTKLHLKGCRASWCAATD